MKKIIISLLCLLAFSSLQHAEAKGIIIYHNGDTFKTLEQLPPEAEIDGTHVNLGVAFKQFGLFWLPLWNYGDVEYALISDNEENAWVLDGEDLAYYKTEFNLDIPDEPSIPFWTKVGLKPIVILLILFLIWGNIPSKKKEEAE